MRRNSRNSCDSNRRRASPEFTRLKRLIYVSLRCTAALSSAPSCHRDGVVHFDKVRRVAASRLSGRLSSVSIRSACVPPLCTHRTTTVDGLGQGWSRFRLSLGRARCLRVPFEGKIHRSPDRLASCSRRRPGAVRTTSSPPAAPPPPPCMPWRVSKTPEKWTCGKRCWNATTRCLRGDSNCAAAWTRPVVSARADWPSRG